MIDNFFCPVCKVGLVLGGSEIKCSDCGRVYEVVDGVADFFVGDLERDFGNDPNQTWLAPEIVEARDTVYRLCTRELAGMAFCMAEIGRLSRPGTRILEVGMGTGHFTRWLSEAAGEEAEIYAFDFSRPIIEKAKKNTAGLENVTLFRANARGPLPFPDGYFDIVFLRLVPFGGNGKPKVQAGYEMLKPGGYYFEAGWEKTPYETPPTDWAMQHGFERAEHHLWQYGRLQSNEEREAWEIEMNHLRAMGKKIVPPAEDVHYEDGSVLKRTVEYLLIARRSEL